MTLNDFIKIILNNASEELRILTIGENKWNNFTYDEFNKKYQIELYKIIDNAVVFSGYIFYLENRELSLYSIDHFYDNTRRRKKVGMLSPQLEWTKKIKKAV